MKSAAEHNMLTQQGEEVDGGVGVGGGVLIKVNYNPATCNPCSHYWGTSQAGFPGYSNDIPAWTANVKHQQKVLKNVISAHVGH